MFYSETIVKLYLPNRTELNMGSELFQYFDVYMSSVRSNRTRKIIEILKKFDPTNSIEFDSVRFDIPGKF